MGNYIKSKNYIIRPSKRAEVVKYIEENFKDSKYQQALSHILNNKAMSWKRWMYYFDFNFLEEILMEEDCVEIDEPVDNLGI